MDREFVDRGSANQKGSRSENLKIVIIFAMGITLIVGQQMTQKIRVSSTSIKRKKGIVVIIN